MRAASAVIRTLPRDELNSNLNKESVSPPSHALASSAASPAAAHLSIAVVEGQPPPSLATCAASSAPDQRVFSITPGSQAVLASLGAWDRVAAVRATPFDSMQVWDALGAGHVRFNAAEQREAQLGWIVENRVLLAAMHDRLVALAADRRITLLCPSAVASVRLPPAGDLPPLSGGGGTTPGGSALAEVALADGGVLRARLVVGADGARSAVRSAAGVGTWGWQYDQRGVVATVVTDRPHATAWQRFLPQGPLAVLPLWGNYSSIVWSTTPDHAALLTRMDEAAFVAALNTVLASPPAAFGAAMRGGSTTSSSGGEGEASADEGADATYDAERDTVYLDAFAALAALGQDAAGRLAGTAASPSSSSSSSTSGGPRGCSSPLPASSLFVAPPTVVASPGPRAAFPLTLSHANRYVGPRMALIG